MERCAQFGVPRVNREDAALLNQEAERRGLVPLRSDMRGVDVLWVAGQVRVCVEVEQVAKHVHVAVVSCEVQGGE